MLLSLLAFYILFVLFYQFLLAPFMLYQIGCPRYQIAIAFPQYHEIAFFFMEDQNVGLGTASVLLRCLIRSISASFAVLAFIPRLT